MVQGTSLAVILHVGKTSLLDTCLQKLEPYTKDDKRPLVWSKRELDGGIGIAPAEDRQKADQERDNPILRAHEQKRQCEALYAEGRIIDAAVSLVEFANTVNDDIRANWPIMD